MTKPPTSKLIWPLDKYQAAFFLRKKAKGCAASVVEDVGVNKCVSVLVTRGATIISKQFLAVLLCH